MKIELLENKNILAYTLDNGVSLNFLLDSYCENKEEVELFKCQYRLNEGLKKLETPWSLEYAFNITDLKLNKPLIKLNLK